MGLTDYRSERQLKEHDRPNKKLLQLFLLLFVLFACYLSVGSIAFIYIESEAQAEIDMITTGYLSKFIERYRCTKEEEVLDLIYNVTGYSFGHRFEHNFNHSATRWHDFHQTLFFSSTIVTTIGYGDMILQTTEGRWFCIIYACIGIPLTAVFVSHIGTIFVKVWKTSLRRLRSICKAFSKRERNQWIHGFFAAAILSTTTFILFLIILSVVVSIMEKWTVAESFYFCFISLSTIGFGDYVIGQNYESEEDQNKFLLYVTIFYLILGLSVLSAIFKAIVEYNTEKVKKMADNANLFISRNFSSAFHEQKCNKTDNNIYIDTDMFDSSGIFKYYSHNVGIDDTDGSFGYDKSTQTCNRIVYINTANSLSRRPNLGHVSKDRYVNTNNSTMIMFMQETALHY